MALIKFKVQTAGPGAPKVVSDDVVNLHDGDRLLFVADDGVTPILVDLGGPPNDPTQGSLVALVKFKGGDASNFVAVKSTDGPIVVKLAKPGGGGPEIDPPG